MNDRPLRNDSAGAFCAGCKFYSPSLTSEYIALGMLAIPSACSDRISPGRSDLHSTSPSCDSWDYHAGIDVIY